MSEPGGILILGAGGHGKVVGDILRSSGKQVTGFLDDNPELWGTTCFNLPVLGAVATFLDYKPSGIVLGVGSNTVRKRLVQTLGDVDHDLWINAIHPHAVVAESVRLGFGNVICAGAIVNPDAVIANHTIVNTSATVDHDCVIGDYAHIAPGVHLAGGVHIGEGVLMGIGATVVPYLTIGEWAIIGAGAAVVRNVPPGITAKGVPARWS